MNPSPPKICARQAAAASFLAAALLLAAVLPLPAPAVAAVYRCTGSDGPPRFQQFPCARGSPGVPLVLEPMPALPMPALSNAEQRLLEELDRRRQAEQQRRARDRERTRRDARALRHRQRERCEAVRSARAALAVQRRKGYRLKDARTLDRRDAELRAEERRHC